MFSALRASPSASRAMASSASGWASRLRPPRPRSGSPRARVRIRQALEHVDATAGEEGRDDLEGRVLGGRAHQDDRAVLDVREEGVLLRLVEAVDLVHEEHGALGGPREPPLGFRHERPDLLHA